MLIRAIYKEHDNLEPLRWFYGDAAQQRAVTAKGDDESLTVYLVEMVFEGVFSSKCEYGYAIGKEKIK